MVSLISNGYRWILDGDKEKTISSEKTHLSNLDVREIIEKVREAFFSSLPINSAQFFNPSEENKPFIDEELIINDQGSATSDKKPYDTQNAHRYGPSAETKSFMESGSLVNEQTISASDKTTYATQNLHGRKTDLQQELKSINHYLSIRNHFYGDLVELEPLGSGAFGEVHRVFDKISRRYLAKKTIRKNTEDTTEKKFRNTVLSEIEAALTLINPLSIFRETADNSHYSQEKFSICVLTQKFAHVFVSSKTMSHNK